MVEEHSIFIGGKPFMNYVTAVVMQFTTKGAASVVVKSRGKFISRAVDVVEVVRKRFLNDQIEVKDVKIGSEDFTNREGKPVSVSTLEITLGKKQK
ncbi:MAG TPA: DNA-binding protein Alba [Candidatus Nanoarchaeia archaeon]|nr:DNA-binding protein Alba [Candidatus Nanoarchaeia archaeon]